MLIAKGMLKLLSTMQSYLSETLVLQSRDVKSISYSIGRLESDQEKLTASWELEITIFYTSFMVSTYSYLLQ